jgi:hypothetical protein
MIGYRELVARLLPMARQPANLIRMPFSPSATPRRRTESSVHRKQSHPVFFWKHGQRIGQSSRFRGWRSEFCAFEVIDLFGSPAWTRFEVSLANSGLDRTR